MFAHFHSLVLTRDIKGTKPRSRNRCKALREFSDWDVVSNWGEKVGYWRNAVGNIGQPSGKNSLTPCIKIHSKWSQAAKNSQKGRMFVWFIRGRTRLSSPQSQTDEATITRNIAGRRSWRKSQAGPHVQLSKHSPKPRSHQWLINLTPWKLILSIKKSQNQRTVNKLKKMFCSTRKRWQANVGTLC